MKSHKRSVVPNALGQEDPFTKCDRGQVLSAIPLYEQVKARVTARIVAGEWVAGFVLPSESELARLLSVSVGTVRRALSDLTKEGMLARKRRTGTVVTDRPPMHTLRQFYHHFRLHHVACGLVKSRADTIAIERRGATAAEARHLRIGRGERVVGILRRRLVNEEVVMTDRLIIQATRIPGFPCRPAEAPELIYAHLLEDYGLRVAAVRESLTAALASEEDCRLLCLPDTTTPTPILVIEAVAFDPADAPLIYAVHRSLTGSYAYINEVR